MGERAPVIYKFGSFRLDPEKRLLSSNGQVISIAPKPFETLLVLVQRHGQVVLKDELITLIWADAFVEEANISQNVFLLRKLLGKDEKGRQYIETVPRRGYRFIGKVREEPQRSPFEGSAYPRREQSDSKDKPTADVGNGFTTSVAILPFENVGADREIEYLSDGITESIINTLSQVSQLRVIARTSVFRYKGREISVREVARELKVDTVMTGRVIPRGDRLNVQIEFSHVPDESQFWGKRYDVELAEMLEAQARIAREVLAQLKSRLRLELSGEESKLTGARHASSKVYQLYLRGCYYQNKLTEEGLRKGLECFQQVIAKEPTFALAYTGLADCYALGGLPLNHNPALVYDRSVDCYALKALGPSEATSKAKAAALTALELDNKLAEAHAAMGLIRYRLDWDWPAAERDYRRAIELNPNNAKFHYRLSMCLRTLGRLDEALAEAKLAHEIDPFMHIVTVELGRIFYFARYYDQAIEYYREVIELESSFLPAHFRLGQAYTQKGMYEEAIAEFQRAIPPTGDDSAAVAALAYVYALSGRTEEARAVLNKLIDLSLKRYVSAYDLAIIYLGLNDKEKALEWLKYAYADRSVCLIDIKVEPMLDSLRSDARFMELVRRVGFEL